VDVYGTLAHPAAMTVFVATLLLPVAVGLLALARTRSQSDFFVGGRAMGRITVALSAVSSGRSSWLVLGASGMAYTMGVSAVWAILGYTVVELFQFVFIGRRLRSEAETGDAVTLLDWLEHRFGDTSHVLRLVGALLIGVFLTAYVAAQLNAGGKALAAAVNLPLLACLGISAALILVYMLLGGFIAVAFNDAVRAVIMLVGLVALPAVGIARLGGPAALLEQLQLSDASLVDPLSLGLGALIGFLGIGLGSPGQPHILVRYMAIARADDLRFSALVGTIWNVILGWGAVMVGLLGRVMVPAVDGLPNRDPEMIYLVLSSELFGPVVFGLLVGGIFAAILSTADSQLLVVASTAARDVWQQVIRGGAEHDEAGSLMVSRVVVVVAGLASLVLAWFAQDLVFWLVLFAWGGLGAAFGPVVMLGLFWKGTSRNGALAGMVFGAAVTITWRLWLKAPTGIYELIPGFAAGLLATVVVSLVSPPSKST
jgi:SSS family solute:Na+ symporter